jgi:hypothetical protein
MQGGQWFSVARDWITQVQKGTWDKVFVLLDRKEVSLEEGDIILHQVPRLLMIYFYIVIQLALIILLAECAWHNNLSTRYVMALKFRYTT